MLNPREVSRDAPIEVKEEFLSRFMVAMDRGLAAVEAVASGGPPDIEGLEAYVQVLDALRVGAEDRTLTTGDFLEPTEEDVSKARLLVQRVREGASSEALLEPARRALRVITDGSDLALFQAALFCLEDETARRAHLARLQEVLDSTILLFQNGCRASTFVATPDDVAGVRRLREIVTAEGAEERVERQRWVRELEARLPRSGSAVERETAAKSLYLHR